MLYTHEETFKIVLRVYEYLQVKSKKQPRTIKLDKPLHRSAVVSFLGMLPPTAGADFIWDFLVFQFYIFSTQEHANKPMPSWFMGKEAWNRWNTYSDEAKWHSKKWASENKLFNPIKLREFKDIEKDVFRRERLRMSRISGPNFCQAKYGNYPYNPDDRMCFTCPFKRDCELLFGEKDSTGKNLFERVSISAENKSEVEKIQLSGTKVISRNIIFHKYGEDF